MTVEVCIGGGGGRNVGDGESGKRLGVNGGKVETAFRSDAANFVPTALPDECFGPFFPRRLLRPPPFTPALFVPGDLLAPPTLLPGPSVAALCLVGVAVRCIFIDDPEPSNLGDSGIELDCLISHRGTLYLSCLAGTLPLSEKEFFTSGIVLMVLSCPIRFRGDDGELDLDLDREHGSGEDARSFADR